MRQIKFAFILIFSAIFLPIALAAPHSDARNCVTGSLDERIEACSRLIDNGPQDAHWIAYYERGKAYESKGQLDKAIEDLSAAIKIKPFAVAFCDRGNIYFAKHQYERSIGEYDEAIKLNPKYTCAFNNRGSAYSKIGKFDEAIADYSQAIRHSPQDASYYAGRGFAYEDKGDYEHALADLNMAIQLNPTNADSYVGRGHAYRAQGAYDKAIADFDKAISLNPESEHAYINRGVAHQNKGEFDLAIADAARAIALNPTQAESFANRASALLNQGNFERAEADLNKVISLEPQRSGMRIFRAVAYHFRNKRAEALNELGSAKKIDPPNVDYARLWEQIVEGKRGPDGAAPVDFRKWPGPILEAYLGRAQPEAALAAATSPELIKEKAQLCEAHFYIGELRLLEKANAEGIRHLRIAAESCDNFMVERIGAIAELKRLGVDQR